jgi:hypothetical protein
MSNGGTPGSHLMPGDLAYHDDKQLIADLTTLNGQISRYVLRHLDAEAKRAVPTSPDDDRALGLHLVRFGTAVLERAERRQHLPQVNVPATETTT